MKGIIVRDGRDTFVALMIAQGMTDAGARVVSVASHADRLHVFAEYEAESDDFCDVIDAAIDKRLEVLDAGLTR